SPAACWLGAWDCSSLQPARASVASRAAAPNRWRRFMSSGCPCFLLGGLGSKRFELGVAQHQPFAAFILEIHLHPSLGAGAFEVEDGAFAEQRVAHALAEVEGGVRHAGAVEQRRAAHAAVVER